MKNIDNIGNILHVDKVNYAPFSVVKQEDNLVLTLELYKNGTELDVTGQTIELAAKRADNVVVQQTEGFVIDKNKVTITLRNNVIEAVGIVQCELNIKDSVGSFTTSNFSIRVSEKILGETSLNASDNIQALEKVKKEFVDSSNKLKADFTATSKALEKEFADTNKGALDDFNGKGATALQRFSNSSTESLEGFTNVATNKIEEFNRETTASLNTFNNSSTEAINTFKSTGDKQIADNQLDYDSLKKVIIAENQAALLQDNINKNKTEIDNIKNHVPVWQDHNGTNGSLTINDGFEETIKDLVVRGKTLGGYNAETGQSDSIVSTGESEGNKIVVKSVGKNLIDYQKATFPSFNTNKTYPNEIIPNGVRIFRYSSGFVPMLTSVYLQANKSYKPSGDVIKKNHDLALHFMVYRNGVGIHNFLFTKTFTPTESGIYEVGFENSGVMTSPGIAYTDFTNIQLEESTIATEYEEYKVDKKEILLPFEGGLKGIQNGRNDHLDLENGTITENTIKLIINDTNFQLMLKGEKSKYLETNSLVKKSSASLCDKFACVSIQFAGENNPVGYMITADGNIRIKPFEKNDMTLQEGLNWLKDNPLTFICERKELVIHNIEKLTLPQYAGITHLIIENEVAGDISCKAKVSLSAQGKRLREENQKLKIENEKLIENAERTAQEQDVQNITITNTEMATVELFEMILLINMPVKNMLGGKSMVEVYVSLILKGKKTLEEVPSVIRPQVEQMLKDLEVIK